MASWNAISSEWFVEVAVIVCLTDFQEMGALFFRNMYAVCYFPEVLSDLKPASVYPMISSLLSLVYNSPKSLIPLK